MVRYLKINYLLSRTLSRFHEERDALVNPQMLHVTRQGPLYWHLCWPTCTQRNETFFVTINERGVCPNLPILSYEDLVGKFWFTLEKKGYMFTFCHYFEQCYMSSKPENLAGGYTQNQKMLLSHSSLYGTFDVVFA